MSNVKEILLRNHLLKLFDSHLHCSSSSSSGSSSSPLWRFDEFEFGILLEVVEAMTLGGSSSAPSGPALSSVGGNSFPGKLANVPKLSLSKTQ